MGAAGAVIATQSGDTTPTRYQARHDGLTLTSARRARDVEELVGNSRIEEALRQLPQLVAEFERVGGSLRASVEADALLPPWPARDGPRERGRAPAALWPARRASTRRLVRGPLGRPGRRVTPRAGQAVEALVRPRAGGGW